MNHPQALVWWARLLVVEMNKRVDIYQRYRNAVLGFCFWHADKDRFIEAVEWFMGYKKPGQLPLQTYCDHAGLHPQEVLRDMMAERPDMMRLYERVLQLDNPADTRAKREG
jgi:hypothetical protein